MLVTIVLISLSLYPARGLDIPDLTYVINFEIPSELNTYIHRSGRTGRMNKKGHVVTLGDDHDFRNLKKMLKDEFSLQRVYFEGYHLTTTKPEEQKKKMANPKDNEPNKKKRTTKKKRWRNKKNKGYHPHKRKEGK